MLLLDFSTLSGQNILPPPQSMEMLPDTFYFSSATRLAVQHQKELAAHPVGETAIQLLEHCGMVLFDTTGKVEIRRVILRLSDRNSHHNLKSEGYLLLIKPKEIQITALDHAGLLYGVQTLCQLLYTHEDRGWMPCLKIIDYPAFSFRGVMDDISRGPLPNMDFLKKQIRRLSQLKINVFSFYIEHVLRTRSHPDIAPDDGLTIDQLKELSEYAQGYNIKILGSFQSLGHFRNILSHPKYAHLGVSDRMLHPGDSLSLAFLRDIYDEIIPVTEHEIFNVNCDETYDLARGHDLKTLADSIGEGGVYSQHVVPLLKYVQSRNKRPAMWGDVLLQYPRIFDQLPSETVILPWDYSDRRNFDELIDPIIDRGFDFVACPGIVNSYRLWPDLLEAHNNIKYFSLAAAKKKGLGTLTTVWDDGGRHFFATDWYGVALAGTCSWNPGVADQNFSELFSSIFLRTRVNAIKPFLYTLQKLQSTDRLTKLSNTLIETEYPLASRDTVYLDTTELTTILHLLLDAQEYLREMDMFGDDKQFNWSEDLIYWDFKLTEMIHAVQMPYQLLEFTADIDELRTSGNETKRTELLITLKSKAMSLLAFALQLRDHFTRLWYRENRRHWYAEAIEIYDARIKTWQNMLNLLSRLANSDRIQESDKPRQSLMFRSSAGTYITYWLGAGPFDTMSNHPIDFDHFNREEGEAALRPGAVDYFLNQEDRYQGWKKIISRHPCRLDFHDFYNTPRQDLAYASCQIVSADTDKVNYELRCTGDFKLYLNGKMVTGTTSGENRFLGSLDLQPGKNYLLFKSLETRSAPWDFSFRILDRQVQQNKYRYTLLQGF